MCAHEDSHEDSNNIGFDPACSNTTNVAIFFLFCLGQYPITLENISVVDLDEVRADFHIGGISRVSLLSLSHLSIYIQ